MSEERADYDFTDGCTSYPRYRRCDIPPRGGGVRAVRLPLRDVRPRTMLGDNASRKGEW